MQRLFKAEFFNTGEDLLVALILFLAGLLIAISLAKRLGTDFLKGVALYLWHTAFCLYFLSRVNYQTSDAIRYYNQGLQQQLDFSIGTGAIDYLSWIGVQWLGLSLLSLFLVANILGTVGLLAFDAAMRQAVGGARTEIKFVAYAIPFLPSISFWSSALGKDSIAFMSVGLILYGLVQPRVRVVLVYLAIALMALIRPHIGAMLVISWVAAVVLFGQMPPLKKAVFVIALGGIAVFLALLASAYVGLAGSLDLTAVMNYLERRETLNLGARSSIDLVALSFPERVFAYLFRPTLLEARSIDQMVTAAENLVFLGLIAVGLMAMARLRFRVVDWPQVFMVLYSMLMLWVLANTTANLGIAARQKWMFLPFVLYLSLFYIARAIRDRSRPVSIRERRESLDAG
jgi:hypothetical protein